MEDIRSENVAPINLELIEALKEEIKYLRDEHLTKASFITILTEKQTLTVETTLTPKIHQLDTQTQNKVTSKTWPQEERISKNTKSGSKRVPEKMVYKSANNEIAGNDSLQKKQDERKKLSKKQKKESRRKKTLIVGDSIINHIAGWRLNKIMKSAVSVRSIP